MVKERPILFSSTMIEAIKRGKSQTRRIVELTTDPNSYSHAEEHPHYASSAWQVLINKIPNGQQYSLCCPYGQPGERLWVKETFRLPKKLDDKSPSAVAESCLDAGYRRPWAPIEYVADGQRVNWTRSDWGEFGKTRVSIHMPRWASRFLLEITAVRLQRLQDITPDDARAEGMPTEMVDGLINGEPGKIGWIDPIMWFASAWCGINGKDAWLANPWVWALTFKRVEVSRA